MQNFKIGKKISDGAFGTVFQVSITKQELKSKYPSNLAIKQVYSSSTNLQRQLKILRKLPNSDHIIKTYQTFTQNFMTNIVMERGSYDLYHWMSTVEYPISEEWVKNIAFQILTGLQCVHSSGIVHRDLKPSNLIIKDEGIISLCDFGSAVECSKGQDYELEGFTRWYKAPEMLFGSRNYGFQVDVWSVGCILMQIATGEPFFNGKSEIELLALISQTLGDPSTKNWPSIVKLPDYKKISFKVTNPKSIQQISEQRSISKELATFIFKMVRYQKRKTVKQLLKDEYFKDVNLNLKDHLKESKSWLLRKSIFDQQKKSKQN